MEAWKQADLFAAQAIDEPGPESQRRHHAEQYATRKDAVAGSEGEQRFGERFEQRFAEDFPERERRPADPPGDGGRPSSPPGGEEEERQGLRDNRRPKSTRERGREERIQDVVRSLPERQGGDDDDGSICRPAVALGRPCRRRR